MSIQQAALFPQKRKLAAMAREIHLEIPFSFSKQGRQTIEPFISVHFTHAPP